MKQISQLTSLAAYWAGNIQQTFLGTTNSSIDPIPYSIRSHWMREANAALSKLDSPCPFAAFGTVIVNHTANEAGDIVCIGMNSRSRTGNPTLHGEIAAITNCTKVLTDPSGKYKLSPSEAQEAFSQLSLYTNGEACPMCASAIRWAGFREYIYGTSIDSLKAKGWSQIDISSEELFERSSRLPRETRLVPSVLAEETDPYFSWQFDASGACPHGCARSEVDGVCRE